ncbi:hypothetical protein AZ34_11830 [Hylemonella gracilis str. Niagara R]|uniref:Bacteriophage Mu Gp45 N-terminal domain-containing protein n=1 Tax=Hylemonella gracilis str. Niagara R TaxID=1458275 RepID=A0A016XKF3_9BURK|nr:phage baseplate assembly protein V [Hylemonella gracilis]EYC51698.1 hypothetical protein AZ34_11830 [Hylemonella gracilis str. Niagara R]
MSIERFVAAALEPLRSRVQLMVGRAILKVVDDAGAIQRVQMSALAGELIEAERVQQYGFSSVPLQGAEAVFLAVGGDRGHAVVVAADDRRHRPRELKAGEVCLYNNKGAFILLDKDGHATVSAPMVTLVASDKVRIDAPTAEFTGDVVDNCETNTVTMAQMRTIFNLHTQPVSGGTAGAPTPLME